jgi:anti-anti-sigma factor
MASSHGAPDPRGEAHRVDGPPHGIVPGQPLLAAIPVQLAGHAILILVGEVDLGNAGSVREAASRCLRREPQSLSLDLSALTFCDVCGLRALRWVRAEAESRGVEFRITGADNGMRRLFALAQADDLLAATTPLAPGGAGPRNRSATDPGPASDQVDSVTSLSVALQLRELIGEAAGVLMQRHGIDARAALAMLESAARRTGVEPRLVAEHVVRTGQDPDQVTADDPANHRRPATAPARLRPEPGEGGYEH